MAQKKMAVVTIGSASFAMPFFSALKVVETLANAVSVDWDCEMGADGDLKETFMTKKGDLPRVEFSLVDADEVRHLEAAA